MENTSDDEPKRAPSWIAPAAAVVAVGLLGAGIYAVFFSKNGAGTVALLTVGALALFMALYHDQIKSMEFGGAKIQFALKIKDTLKRAFEVRLSGNYEQAEDELERAFTQFVAQENGKRWKEYKTATEYQDNVREKLRKILEVDFMGCVWKTASSLSFLPLIDVVMDLNGPSIKDDLTKHGLNQQFCQELETKLQGELRVGVIIRPGPDLNSEELVGKLGEEVENGPLNIHCFLLVQNCKGSKSSSREFRDLAIQRGMHATSLEWDPNSGRDRLADALRGAILSVCDPNRCPSPTSPNSRPSGQARAAEPSELA